MVVMGVGAPQGGGWWKWGLEHPTGRRGGWQMHSEEDSDICLSFGEGLKGVRGGGTDTPHEGFRQIPLTPVREGREGCVWELHTHTLH